MDDIYFLTQLSHRGLETTLTGVALSNVLFIHEYTQQYCGPHAQVNSSGVPIKQIVNLSIEEIVYTINHMVGSTIGHLATWPYMFLALSCLEINIYDWCSSLWSHLHKQLTTCHDGKKKAFGYGTLICCFFLEKVSSLQPWVPIEMPLLSVPWMLHWVIHFYILRGGEGPQTFDDDFFSWWV